MCVCVCEYLGEEEDAEVELFSVDSLDPPTSSDPLLEEQFPKKMNSFITFPLFFLYHLSCTEKKNRLPYSH